MLVGARRDRNGAREIHRPAVGVAHGDGELEGALVVDRDGHETFERAVVRGFEVQRLARAAGRTDDAPACGVVYAKHEEVPLRGRGGSPRDLG